MNEQIVIARAGINDSTAIAVMVGELLTEISDAIGIKAFNFDQDETTARLEDFLKHDKYFVFIARSQTSQPIGFISLYQSYALYSEGVFGTVAELYVHPQHRSKTVGTKLILQAKSLGASRGWKRLEVTTPPLPQFPRTLTFYEREGFRISGGRKLKLIL